MERESRIKEEIIGILCESCWSRCDHQHSKPDQWAQSIFTNTHELENWLGRFGANLSEILLQSLGFSAYIIPAIFLIFGIKKVFAKAANQKLSYSLLQSSY